MTLNVCFVARCMYYVWLHFIFKPLDRYGLWFGSLMVVHVDKLIMNMGIVIYVLKLWPKTTNHMKTIKVAPCVMLIYNDIHVKFAGYQYVLLFCVKNAFFGWWQIINWSWQIIIWIFIYSVYFNILFQTKPVFWETLENFGLETITNIFTYYRKQWDVGHSSDKDLH